MIVNIYNYIGCMEHLLVSYWYKNAGYEIQCINGVQYIVPYDYGLLFDLIKSENKMMIVSLNLDKYLTENVFGQNEKLLDFLYKYYLLGK